MQRWYFTMGMAVTAVGAAFWCREGNGRSIPVRICHPGHRTTSPRGAAFCGTRLPVAHGHARPDHCSQVRQDQYLVFEVSSPTVVDTHRQPVHLPW